MPFVEHAPIIKLIMIKRIFIFGRISIRDITVYYTSRFDFHIHVVEI